MKLIGQQKMQIINFKNYIFPYWLIVSAIFQAETFFSYSFSVLMISCFSLTSPLSVVSLALMIYLLIWSVWGRFLLVEATLWKRNALIRLLGTHRVKTHSGRRQRKPVRNTAARNWRCVSRCYTESTQQTGVRKI